MPGSFFTAMSWFRSSASYFSGCNTARPDPSDEGQREGKNARRSGCIGRALMLEQIENIAPEPLARRLLWKSMMAQQKAATWPGAWD
jgi:hypothetical protein